MRNTLFTLFLLLSLNLTARAQEKQQISNTDYANTSVTMADQMRAEGKIYVVVAVLVIILAGLLFYVFRLDGRISTMEKEINRNKK